MIEWLKIKTEAIIPVRATKGSVGYDIKCIEDVVLEPNELVLIDTGLTASFPPSYWLGIYGRSSFGAKGIINPLGVGVVDSDYSSTGYSIKVALYNTTNESFFIEEGTSIAQGVFHKSVLLGDEVETERKGGFGSTDGPRVRLFVHGNPIDGVLKPDLMSLSNGLFDDPDDFVFVADRPHEKLHDGGAGGYDLTNRCWHVSLEEKGVIWDYI